jgi:hypothetical protein
MREDWDKIWDEPPYTDEPLTLVEWAVAAGFLAVIVACILATIIAIAG